MAVDGSSRLGCLLFGVKDNLIFQFGFQHPKITVAQDAAKIFLGGQEGCRHPAQHHLAIPPAAYPVGPEATPAWGLSMILVVPRQRRRAGDNSRRLMVKVSSRPSRRLAAAPG